MKAKDAIEFVKIAFSAWESDYDTGEEDWSYAHEAKDIAIAALEKQVPKKPIDGYVFREQFRNVIAKKDPEMASRTGSCCPCCGKHIGKSEAALRRKNYTPFCGWCGQALKQPEGE